MMKHILIDNEDIQIRYEIPFFADGIGRFMYSAKCFPFDGGWGNLKHKVIRLGQFPFPQGTISDSRLAFFRRSLPLHQNLPVFSRNPEDMIIDTKKSIALERADK